MRVAGGRRTRSEGRVPVIDASLIQVDELTKCYGAIRAVDRVSFGVERGETVALLGPNGSGKSTLMRCLIGFFAPTSGRVCIGGVDVAERPVVARRQIGYLPENVSLYPELSVRRYLRFVAGVKGLGRREGMRAVAAALEQCGLAEVATRATGKLSKGYRQRVGLAQALLGDPEVLVLDEPTVGLDPMQTIELREVIRALVGRTVLLSTHILSEASTLCSRVMILKGGRLVAIDTPQDLSKRVARVARIMVRVDAPPLEAERALAGIPGVASVEVVVEPGGRGVLFRVAAPDPEPVQRRIAVAIVERGWALLEVRVDIPTLEELFVRLVG